MKDFTAFIIVALCLAVFCSISGCSLEQAEIAPLRIMPLGDSKTTVEQKVEAIIPAVQQIDKKVLILETGAPYIKHDNARTQDFDREMVTEVSPLGQRKHLEKVCKLVTKIPDGRGMGVLTWGSDITKGIHKWDHVTWNRAQVTRDKVALPSLYVFAEYAEDLEKPDIEREKSNALQ